MDEERQDVLGLRSAPANVQYHLSDSVRCARFHSNWLGQYHDTETVSYIYRVSIAVVPYIISSEQTCTYP